MALPLQDKVGVAFDMRQEFPSGDAKHQYVYSRTAHRSSGESVLTDYMARYAFADGAMGRATGCWDVMGFTDAVLCLIDSKGATDCLLRARAMDMQRLEDRLEAEGKLKFMPNPLHHIDDRSPYGRASLLVRVQNADHP
ncbi:MAG: hypothetical protein KAW89_08590 [Armatimonadetes bacterium]|nr:hypothetical protein [Armatimonadota bacterium]